MTFISVPTSLPFRKKHAVFATVDSNSRHKGICAFFIETSWPGVSIGSPIPKMGQRCSNTVGIHFRDVRVPRENIIAMPGEGFVLAMKTFARTRPIIGSFGVGAARATLEYSLDYVKKRRAFGNPIKDFQAIQFKLAEMFPIEKLLRDVRLLRIYEGTSEIQRIILADHLLNKYTPSLPALEDLPLNRSHDPLDLQAPPNTEKVWRCRICGHIHYGDTPPSACPYCFFPDKAFKEINKE